MRFDEATAVRNAPSDSTESGTGPKRYDAEIAKGWSIHGNANGGYLLGLAGRALSEHTGRPDPVTITAHYLSPGPEGPIRIRTETVKEGRRFCVARATVIGQGGAGKPIIEVLGTFGDLSQAEGPERVDATPPDLPPVEDCVDVGARSGEIIGPEIFRTIDVRLHPDDADFANNPSGTPQMRGWFRLKNEEPMDVFTLLLAADALPPTVFNANLPISWVPTLELTAHVRANPAPGWLQCEFSTRFITGGFLEEDGLIWDSTGTLVAQSRQLALTPQG